MGSPTDEPGRFDDEDLHQVTLTRSFLIDTFETSQREWFTLVGNEPSDELFAEAGELAAAAAEPHDDVRGTAAWKRQVVRTFTRRALASAAEQAQG